MSPTKRKTPSKAQAKVIAIADKLGKKFGSLAARAEGQVTSKRAWVVGKVRGTLGRIDDAMGK